LNNYLDTKIGIIQLTGDYWSSLVFATKLPDIFSGSKKSVYIYVAINVLLLINICIKMSKKPDFRKIWIILFFFTGILFLVLGMAKIFADQLYLQGIAQLIFSVTLLIAAVIILKGRLIIEYSSGKMIVLINSGFLFMIIGGAGTNSLTIFALGYILLIAGMIIPANSRL